MSKLNLITTPGKFKVLNPGGNTKFRFRGNDVNLADIEEADAERIAADPGCRFLQLKDVAAAPPAAPNATAKAPEAAK